MPRDSLFEADEMDTLVDDQTGIPQNWNKLQRAANTAASLSVVSSVTSALLARSCTQDTALDTHQNRSG